MQPSKLLPTPGTMFPNQLTKGLFFWHSVTHSSWNLLFPGRPFEKQIQGNFAMFGESLGKNPVFWS